MSARLVGRDAALALAGAALAGASGGAGRLLLCSGEPGIGKTALVRAVAEDAARAGARVVWSACPPGGGAPAYWPWAQVVRDLDVDQPAPALSPLLDRKTSVPVDTADRFELYDAVARALPDPAGTPTVVVLDDLHWADLPSLDLLDFVARRLGGQPVVVVGTYRDLEAPARLERIAASSDAITLGGIDAAAIIELVTTITAAPPSLAEAEQLRERTGGNPLFVRELARLVVAGGRASGGRLPVTIAETLAERLDRLAPPCLALLAAVAVADDADPELLARVTGEDREAVRSMLAEAEMARVLVGRAAGRRPFAHDLFREALLARQSPADRRRTERSVADALIMTSDPLAPPAARIAAHLVASLPRVAEPESVALTVRWLTEAASQATARLGHEEAVRLYGHAVERAPTTGLLVQLAEAQVRAGDPEAGDTFLKAADLARATGDAAGLASVALGFHRLGARGNHAAQRILLEDAISAVPPLSLDRARLLAALGRDRRHDYSAAHDSRAPAEEAVAIARAAADPTTLAECLLALHDTLWAPGTASARLAVVEEMASAARDAGSSELVAQATLLRAGCLIELNDPRGVAALLDYCQQQESFGHARGRWEAASRRATLELITGAPEAAREHCAAAFELGQHIGIPDVFGVRGTLAWPLSLFIGTRTELVDWMMGIEIDRLRDCFLAAAHRADGDPNLARAVAATIHWPVPDPEALDLEFAALGADALVASPNLQEVRACYDDLLRHAGTNVLVGGCASFWGPVDLYLGELASALGDHALAARHLRDAEAMATTLGAPLWAAHAARIAAELAPDAEQPRLDRDGRVWRVRWRSLEVHVADAKGVRDLATLLARPGTEVAATELMSGRPTGSAQPVLDAEAKAAYRRRLGALDEEIDDADAAGDGVRAERARLERSALIKELSAAVGLGGRDRRLGDDHERARKAVTARIRDAIDRIGEAHPELGAHLSATVHTGAWCSYRPDA